MNPPAPKTHLLTFYEEGGSKNYQSITKTYKLPKLFEMFVSLPVGHLFQPMYLGSHQ
jgi:hypothetical protein